MTIVLAGCMVAGCAFLGVSDNPRANDQGDAEPAAVDGAPRWSSVAWQEATVDIEVGASYEQSDRASAIAYSEAGYVAVGSNSDVMHPIGRIWHSSDGLDWSAVRIPVLDGLDLVDVASGPGGFVAIGTDSTDINDATAIALRSPDGLDWEIAERFDGAWAVEVAGGDGGYLLSLDSWVGDAATSILVTSDTGERWEQIPPAALPIGQGYLPTVRSDGRDWLAAGSAGDRAVVLRSGDASTWTELPLPASTPVDGISSVAAYEVIPGPLGDLLLGLDEATECETDDDWCSRWGAIWSSAGGESWRRLPESNRLLSVGWGVMAWSAGDAGFLAFDGGDLITSPDGWRWDEVPQTDAPTDAWINDVVIVGDRLVAVGDDWSGLESQEDEGPNRDPVWFGVGTIER